MNEKEIELILKFAEKPWKKYTFTDFKNKTKKKSKSYIDSFFKKYIEKEIIKKEQIGKTNIYSLNLDSKKTQAYIGFALENKGWDQKNIPYKSIEKIMKKIPVDNYVLLITGSYAKAKENKNSDLDMAILVEDTTEVKKIYAELKNMCEMSLPEIHLYVFKNKDFLEMLQNEEENYGKEITKNNLILRGGQIYTELISRAIKNGFANKNIP